MRARILAVAALFLAGCGGGDVLVADRELDGIETQELALRVRVSGVVGSWAGIALVADVTAPGAEWASLAPTEGGVGPARRTVDGAVELELGRAHFRPDLCDDGVCELDYVIALDAPPTAPWHAVVSATVDGDAEGDATVEILPLP